MEILCFHDNLSCDIEGFFLVCFIELIIAKYVLLFLTKCTCKSFEKK